MEQNFKFIAEQLRMPHGAFGKEIGEMMNQGNKLMNLATIEQLEVDSHDNILEIGMGNGYFVKDILQNDATILYTGCDYSGEMVNEAFNHNIDFIKKGQARFNRANASKLPYSGEYFNKVFTVNTIYFWDKVEEVLSEIKRVLKNKGVLILALRPRSVMENLPVTKYGFTTFSKGDCRDLLLKNGFDITSVIEGEDADIDLNGVKYKNALMIVKAIKK